MFKRLLGYDYRQPGFYFVTICTQEHRLVFGNVEDGRMYLKSPGQIAQSVWVTLPGRFAHVRLDEYVFMPNHMHAILELTEQDSTHSTPRAALWEIIRAFKAAASYQIRHSKDRPWFAWQDGYYDSVIRTEADLHQLRHYILENPQKWSQDKLYKRY